MREMSDRVVANLLYRVKDNDLNRELEKRVAERTQHVLHDPEVHRVVVHMQHYRSVRPPLQDGVHGRAQRRDYRNNRRSAAQNPSRAPNCI